MYLITFPARTQIVKSAEFEGSTYFASLNELHVNITSMQEVCSDFNGYLAEINSEQEYNFILKFLKSKVETEEASDAVLGASNNNTEEEWRYLQSGDPLNWVSWTRVTRGSSHHCMWIVWNRNDEGLHQYYCDVGWDDLARVVCEVDTGKCKLVYLSTYEFIP